MGSDSIRPETRSRFVSGARRPYRRRSALKNSQWKSMWVTCSVMSHRSLFILSAITHAFYDPWAIEFLYTWRSTPTEDICIFWHTHVQLHQIVTHTHTHTSRPKVWQRAWVRVSTDMWWHRKGDVYRTHAEGDTLYEISIYRQWVKRREEGGTYSGKVTGKVEQKVEGVNKSDWMQ